MNSVCGAINDKVVVVPGDTLHYKFPVEASLGWHFEDSASPSLFKVTHNRTRLELKEQGKWTTCLGSKGFSSGKHTWSVRVERTMKQGNIFIGVATASATRSSCVHRLVRCRARVSLV